ETVTQSYDLTVNNVNDPPYLIANEEASAESGDTITIGDGDEGGSLVYGDVDGDALTYTITGISDDDAGSLFLNGQEVGEGATFTQADIDAGNLTYVVDEFDDDHDDHGDDYDNEFHEDTPEWMVNTQRDGVTVRGDAEDLGASLFDENLTLPESSTATVTFQGSLAGYDSVVGWFKYDEDGNATDPQILWGSSKDAQIGDTETLTAGEGESIGFFIIANKAGWFEDHEIKDIEFGGDVNNIKVTYIKDNGREGTETFGGNEVFTTDVDGNDFDAAAGINNGELWIGFDDQRGRGDDNDFNDVMISLNYNKEETGGDEPSPTTVNIDYEVSDGYSVTTPVEGTFTINVNEHDAA
ncbi:MAG: hypothetical protein OQK23_01395, partial [Rhodospirillales bacterium]|nr:hypothetical protein [Rhodospirillales bacterium]